MSKKFIILIFWCSVSSYVGSAIALDLDLYGQRIQLEKLRNEIQKYKSKPINVTCTWDLPIEQLQETQFPPIPEPKP